MAKATKTPIVSKKAVAALKTSLVVENHELVQTETFLEAIETIALMEEAIDEFWASFKEFAVEHKLKPIKGNWGYITLTDRTTFKATKDLKPRFTKAVIDPDKVRAWAALHGGELPVGAITKKTKYLSKKLHV